MLITRSQGAACRRAAERIADGKWNRKWICEFGVCVVDALGAIGWGKLSGDRRVMVWFHLYGQCKYDQSQVLMALLWCAEIAGEA